MNGSALLIIVAFAVVHVEVTFCGAVGGESYE